MPLLQSYDLRGTKEMSHEYIDVDTGICKICRQDHFPVIIELEHEGFITTTASGLGSKTKTKKHKIADRYLSPDIFWPAGGDDI